MPPAEPNPSTLQEVSSTVYPSLERKPGKADNWVEKAGGLPSYIERIAKHLHYEKGKDIGTAIAIAVNTVKRWATGTNHNGSKLKPQTVAQAQAAVAEWEAKKAKSHVSEAALAEDTQLTAEERASLIGELGHRFILAEGMAIGLKGKGTRARKGRVASAKNLLEGREVKMTLDGGHADPRELARTQSRLGLEVAALKVCLEALGAAPVFPRQQAGPPAPRMGKKPTAKGRNGQTLFDESKHPRAGAGRTGGGQFIKSGAQGPEVKGIQRQVGVKADGKFGPQTKKAVEGFQQEKGLNVDGAVGAQTAAAMRGAQALPGPLLGHHRSALRKAKERFTPSNIAANDAAEKARGQAKKARKEAAKKSSSSSSSTSSTSSTTTPSSGAGSVFGEGSSLPTKIADLIQHKLGIATSGSYDEKTKERVEEFQKNHGLEVDGIVGTQTLAALRGDKTPPAPGGFSKSDWTWLSSHQAGGQRQKRREKQTTHGTERERKKESKRLERERKKEQNRASAPGILIEGASQELLEAISQDDFHRKYGAGMTDQPDDATGHLQNRLTELGYNAGANDGRFGEKTKGAVEEFQGDHGLKKDGEVGSSTKIALRGTDSEEVSKRRTAATGQTTTEDGEKPPKDNGADDTEAPSDATVEESEAPSLAGAVLTKGTGVSEEEPDATVAHMQKTIGAEADGRFGPDTEKKLKSTQRKYGLKADGVVGPKTGRLLDRMASKAKLEESLRFGAAAKGFGHMVSGVEFNPSKHPRDPEGKFSEVLGGLNRTTKRMAHISGGSFGDTTKVLRTVKGFDVFHPATGTEKFKTAEDAAKRALDLHTRQRKLINKRFGMKEAAEARLDAAVLDRMAADAAGDTVAFTRARGREKALREASLRDAGSDALRDFYRLDDGTFAPKGRGAILRPGEKINLPHRSGEGKVTAKVEYGSGGRGLARIISGPDTGQLAGIRTAAPQKSRGRPFPDRARRRADLPPGNPENGSHVAEVKSQNYLDHINHGIAASDDSAVQDHLDDMHSDHAYAEKQGYGEAMKNYDAAKAAGQHFLNHGEAPPEPQRAPIDFQGASDSKLTDLAAEALDANGLPKSGRDKSIFQAAMSERTRRAMTSFRNARSESAKSAAADAVAQLTGRRPEGAPAPQYAPPENFVPNAGEKQLKDMEPGDTFYVGKHDLAYTFHKPVNPPFIIAKPVGGGKAKPFHEAFAPPFIGPSDSNGSPSTSSAAPATNDADLYDALKKSLDTSAPAPPASFASSSPARSSQGNLRNFKAMSDEKLIGLADEMKQHPNDVEAVKAITAELKTRSGKPKLPKTHEPPKVKSADQKISAAWSAYTTKKAAFDALPPETDKKTKAKAASQVRAAKFRIKRVGGDPEKPPAADDGPVVVKAAGPRSKGTPIPPPPADLPPAPPPKPAAKAAPAPPPVEPPVADDISTEDTEANLGVAGALLGDWSNADVAAALDKLEMSGIVFDRAQEAPDTLAAVIKAAGLDPASLQTQGTTS